MTPLSIALFAYTVAGILLIIITDKINNRKDK